jgi:hypothetical protein
MECVRFAAAFGISASVNYERSQKSGSNLRAPKRFAPFYAISEVQHRYFAT